MALDIFRTPYLLAAVNNTIPPATFLKDRYFPTNESTDVFKTEDVLIEYKDGRKKVAPFVAPRHKGITVLRSGSYMERYTPPLVAPRRVLTIDDLNRRGFGEALMSDLTPEDREATMLVQDMDELSQMISRREELMAAEILTTNKCVMKHYADDLTMPVEEKVLQFYDGESNPAEYVPGVKWDAAGARIMDDIHAMIGLLSSRGLPATDLIVSSDVAATIINDETIQKMFDLNNFNIGNYTPVELPDGVSRLLTLNVYGRSITIFAYDETYENEAGETVPIIPEGTAILTAPAAGRGMYGSVTQLEQADGQFHTYAGRRIPKYLSDAYADVRTLTLSSAPLLIPNNKNPWIVAKVLGA